MGPPALRERRGATLIAGAERRQKGDLKTGASQVPSVADGRLLQKPLRALGGAKHVLAAGTLHGASWQD